MTIRKGTGLDTNRCVELWVAACATRDGVAVAGVADRARPKFEHPEAWLVVERGGPRVAGFALATPPGSGMTSDPTGAVVLSLLAVDPCDQGSGLGRQLLDAITSTLAERGYTQAVLHALAENVAAVRLYQTSGWRSDGATFYHALLRRPMQTFVRDIAEADPA